LELAIHNGVIDEAGETYDFDAQLKSQQRRRTFNYAFVRWLMR